MLFQSFDLELMDLIPDGWDNTTSLPMSYVGLLSDGDEESEIFPYNDDHLWTGGMSKTDAQEAVAYMLNLLESKSFAPLGWNTARFDFPVLAMASGMVDECRQLCMASVDMMFQMHCVLGYACGLEKALQGTGVGGKYRYGSVALTGAQIPRLLEIGKNFREARQEQNLVDYTYWVGQLSALLKKEFLSREQMLDLNEAIWDLDIPDPIELSKAYLHADVDQPLRLARHVEAAGGQLTWITQKGYARPADLGPWRTVEECLSIAQPDQSWMDAPISRADYLSFWFEDPATIPGAKIPF